MPAEPFRQELGELEILAGDLRLEEERGLPKQPKRPKVANPSTPGVQPPNKPDGRDAPPAQTQTRDKWLEEQRAQHRADQSPELAAGLEDDAAQAKWRDTRERRHHVMREALWHAKIRPARTVRQARGSSRQARPARRTRRATARSPGSLAGSDDDPPARPPLSAAERDYLRAEVSRRRKAQAERQRLIDRHLFRDDGGAA